MKLCDFGVSVQLAASMAKTVIGTRAYMAVSIHKDSHRARLKKDSVSSVAYGR